jgi:hypothetical protein
LQRISAYVILFLLILEKRRGNKMKKINRGLIVTVVAVLGAVCYLVGLAIVQKGDREEIKKVCAEYLRVHAAYVMLPQARIAEKPDMPEAELDAYVKKMEEDLKRLYVNNEKAYKSELENIKSRLEEQAAGSGVIFSYENKVQKIGAIHISGDTTSVTVTTHSSWDMTPRVISAEGTVPARETGGGTAESIITLQKLDGAWKVVSAYVPYPEDIANPADSGGFGARTVVRSVS